MAPRVAPGAPAGSKAGGRGKLNTPASRPKTPSPSSRDALRGRDGGSGGNVNVRRVAVGAGIVAGLALVSLIVLLVLAQLPVFVITGINATASEHVSESQIAKLASVEEGTTLLNVDTSQITEKVSKNPWVKRVIIKREFPDTLGVSVEERSVAALVVIGGGTSVWALGDDGVWIEPVQLDTSSGEDVVQLALARAQEMGCLLIANVPATVNPAQGAPSTDDPILDVLTYQSQLPDSIRGPGLLRREFRKHLRRSQERPRGLPWRGERCLRKGPGPERDHGELRRSAHLRQRSRPEQAHLSQGRGWHHAFWRRQHRGADHGRVHAGDNLFFER